MDKIDEILERLKGEQPVISDPDALTDRIINRCWDDAVFLCRLSTTRTGSVVTKVWYDCYQASGT